MEQQAAAVADQLDEVVRQAGLLPAGQRLEVLDAAVSKLHAAQADAARDLADSGALTGTGCRTARSWLRLHLRRGIGAFRITRRAQMLPQLPGFAAAFAAGEVTDEHVDTVLRWSTPCGLDAIRAHEEALVALAREASAKELDQALEALADLVRPDRDADKVAALADRSIKIAAAGDLVHIDAMVEPALGEALKTAVEAGAQPPPGIRRGDDPRTLLQRHADAFGEIVMRGIGACPDTRRRTGRLRSQVAMTVSLDRLADIPGAPPALLAHFGTVPNPTAQRLICDGDLARVILDTATGLPLRVGRRHRLAVERQRRALAVVHRHCAFPGCEVPFRFCEIHHRAWWCRDNGATDLDLLLPCCWTHHHFLHEYGFTVAAENPATGTRLVHRRPDGRAIPDPAHHLRRAVAQLRLNLPIAATNEPERSSAPTRTTQTTRLRQTEYPPRPPDDARAPPMG